MEISVSMLYVCCYVDANELAGASHVRTSTSLRCDCFLASHQPLSLPLTPSLTLVACGADGSVTYAGSQSACCCCCHYIHSHEGGVANWRRRGLLTVPYCLQQHHWTKRSNARRVRGRLPTALEVATQLTMVAGTPTEDVGAASLAKHCSTATTLAKRSTLR